MLTIVKLLLMFKNSVFDAKKHHLTIKIYVFDRKWKKLGKSNFFLRVNPIHSKKNCKNRPRKAVFFFQKKKV